MGVADSSGEARERGRRWLAAVVGLVLFVAMPDKCIGLLSAIARLLVAAFVLKVAWDHGAELKALLGAIVEGRLSLKAAGFELQQAKERDREASEELAVTKRLLRAVDEDVDDSVPTGDTR